DTGAGWPEYRCQATAIKSPVPGNERASAAFYQTNKAAKEDIMAEPIPTAGGALWPESDGEACDGLSLYRLTPISQLSDPRWDNSPCHGEITVCALSPADARIVAADAEVDFPDLDAKPAHGTSTFLASAFLNSKLYHVEKVGQRDAR